MSKRKPLSPTMRLVMELACKGLSHAEVAEELKISVIGATTYYSKACSRLQCSKVDGRHVYQELLDTLLDLTPLCYRR